ncbi:hypothetical protein EMPS_05081 [Entomortierella parvispora]|uniref:Uncharacterized protein n=1 Tax=Entomortierella parvispora TaxID=205924 RepID=A0A9P3HAC9_9FUNG|nr:hypothetical protein EMPS_05081 [Entomortierella parvispora]
MSTSMISTLALRSIRAPIQAAARRQMSSVSSAASNTAAGQHSTRKLAIASTLSVVAGIDITYAYFTFVRKD